jgi:hypothetical protein
LCKVDFTMQREKIDWTNFDWRDFQRLCIQIAENLYPDCNFSEYLKHGQKQEGIDLQSFQKKDGKFLCVQCKREKKIIVSDIIKIIKDFVDGDYYEISSVFIIATTADLQDVSLQNEIRKQKIALNANKGIELQEWDIIKVEKELENRWDLVAFYFGKEKADRFCIPQLKKNALQSFSLVEDYIPRKVFKTKENQDEKTLSIRFSNANSIELKNLFLKDQLVSRRICLIADQHQGKSLYLRQLAAELSDLQFDKQPVFIEVKDIVPQRIETILESKYGAWKKIPFKSLVVIIDGLDEAPTDKFTEMLKYINEFCNDYNPISVIYSCRKIFYNRYSLAPKLANLETYELIEISAKEIEDYVELKLGSQTEEFIKKVQKTNITSLLYNPFYLVEIINEYLKPPFQLPENKIKVIENLLIRTYEKAKERQLDSSSLLEFDFSNFKITVEKFALALQIAGLNAFEEIQMQELLSKQELLLLQHNSFVTISNKSWSFTNALFQEHIAALVLAKCHFDKIMTLCSIGKKVKKVKTKWIQTISSLLSIIEKENPLFNEIKILLKEDNIELIFQTEASKHEEDVKLILLKELLERSNNQNVTVFIVREDTIGAFIDSSVKCKEYTIANLIDVKNSDCCRILCSKILCYLTLTPKQIAACKELALSEIPNSNDSYFSKCLIDVLTAHKGCSKNEINQIIAFEKHNTASAFRNSVYYLIIAHELADDFHDFGISGLPILIHENEQIRHYGSEEALELFFLSSKKVESLIKLLPILKMEPLLGDFRSGKVLNEEFFNEYFIKLGKHFALNPMIIFPILDFLIDLGINYKYSTKHPIDNFFKTANAYYFANKILVEKFLSKKVNTENLIMLHFDYEFIFNYHEMNLLSVRDLEELFHSFSYKINDEQKREFYSQARIITEGEIFKYPQNKKLELLAKAEETRIKNDTQYINSISEFKKGVKKYFKAAGKSTINSDDLFVEKIEGTLTNRMKADSRLVTRFLKNKIGPDKTVTLDECLQSLNDEKKFNYFQALQIFYSKNEYTYNERIHISILKEFYDTNISKIEFQNAFKIDHDHLMLKNIPYFLGNIFIKYNFTTEVKVKLGFLWIDNSGFISSEDNYTNRELSISKIVYERLSDVDKRKFLKKIEENLNIGIENTSVLSTHISLCVHYKITSAKDIIFDYINEDRFEKYNLTKAIDAFMNLNGDKERVYTIFEKQKDYNSYEFLHLFKLLKDDFKTELTQIGLMILGLDNIVEECKIRIAEQLTSIGSFPAFSFLVNCLKNTTSANLISYNGNLKEIDTKTGLELISEFVFTITLSHEELRANFQTDIKYIITGWIKSFASKSEDDLILVIDFLKNSKTKLSQNPKTDVSYLNWEINNILESFRNTPEPPKTIREIKKILTEIED